MGDKPQRQQLNSWKEIAAYLRVTVRTAQNWERERRLPVWRIPGEIRGRVFTFVDDLDAWAQGKTAETAASPEGEPPESAPPPVPPPGKRRKGIAGAAAAAALLILTGVLIFRPKAEPAGFLIHPDELIIHDAKGRELWRKDVPGIRPEYYADHGRVWIGDLDRDGHNEVLFIDVTKDAKGAYLYCYARDGNLLWRFVPGRVVRTATESFSQAYHCTDFAVGPAGPDGEMRVAVIGLHRLYYPTQIALLAPAGRVVREYWHSGGLLRIMMTDLKGNGRMQLVTAGVNNATKMATLLVLDPEKMQGASREENTAYQLQGFPPAVETARILFPRSCMNRALEPFLVTSRLWMEAGEIVIEVAHRLNPGPGAAGVYYHFGPDLKLNKFTAGSGFDQIHRGAYAAGSIDHALGAKELEQLAQVKYVTPAP